MASELIATSGDIRPHGHLKLGRFTQHFVSITFYSILCEIRNALDMIRYDLIFPHPLLYFLSFFPTNPIQNLCAVVLTITTTTILFLPHLL